MKRQPLKGLLIFSIFSNKGSLVISSILALFFIISAVVIGFMPLTGLMAMLLFPSVSFFFHNDMVKTDKAKWSKFQLSMPIRRKDVITSQYVYFLLLVVVALLITGLVHGIAYFLDSLNIFQIRWLLDGLEAVGEAHPLQDMPPSQISHIMILIGIGSAFLTCAIYYPLRYTICRGKEELTSFLVMLGSMMIVSPIPVLAGFLEFSIIPLTVVFGLLIPSLLLVCSYFFTVKVYQTLDE